MKARYFLASIFLYCLAFTAISRLRLPPPDQTIISYLDDITFALLLILFFYITYGLELAMKWKFHRVLIFYPAILFVHLMVIAEWWHYEFYRDYIHYASLSYAGDWREILRGLDGFEGRYWALAFFIGSMGVFYVGDHFWKVGIQSRKSLYWSIAVVVVSGSLVGGAYTYIYYAKNILDWQTQSPLPLSYKNPILEIAREKIINNQQIGYITSQHKEALQNIYGEQYQIRAGKISVQSKTKKQPANVIIIILESFREFETGNSPGYSLTPNFDRIASKNFTPKFFYANANQTIKAEIASLCGTHDFMIGTSISAYNGATKINCLPEILKTHGYETVWFHGAYSNFYNRNLFMPKIGFMKMYDRLAIENDLYNEGKSNFIRHWGIEDPYVYEYAINKLESQQQPFFAEILSLSSHHPFVKIERKWDLQNFPQAIHGDMNNMYRKYQHAIYYTDRALGQFWDRFVRSELYKNTIVVIVGDHGIWLFPDGMEQSNPAGRIYETYLRLPMTMYIPGKEYTNPINTPLSQIDIPPLVMSTLMDEKNMNFQSKLDSPSATKLLAGMDLEEDFKNPIFSSIGDGYFFRQGDQRCFPPLSKKKECADYLFRCVEKYNVLETNKECVSWQGDILRDKATIVGSDINSQAADRVVDYYRKVIF